MSLHRRHGFIAVAACIAALLANGPVLAEPFAKAETPETAPSPQKDKKADQEKKEEKPDFPPFEKVTKDFKKIASADPTEEETFLTLWFNEKDDKLLAEIPAALLGKNFLMAASVSGGSLYTGFQWGTTMVQWERLGKRLLLVQPDVRYVEGKESTVSEVVKRSYTARILNAVQIKTESPAGNPLIDLGEIFKSDVSGWARIFGYAVNPGLSKWGKFKAFPKNVELPVETAMSPPEPGSRATRILLHYSLSELPKTDYKPRLADERVGFFMTVTKDWAKKYGEKTLFNRYINRWDLRKVDSSLKLSPVKEPVVWYIEKTVPVRWRRYVKEGILEWNKAFEKCGLLDAVQVRQQTETEFAYLDPEDVRYNFFRWIVTGRSFAAGPSRAHPQTGQILDADIVFDDSMVRSYLQDYDVWAPDSPASAYDPLLQEFLTAHPQWRGPSLVERLLPFSCRTASGQDQVESDAKLAEYMFRRGHFTCQFARGLTHELSLMAAAFRAEGKEELPEEFIGQIIKEIVTHEVGHCLGLRHNFKASTWLDLDEVLKGESRPDRATCGSVMDYNPAVYKLRGEEREPQFITRTIGPYDYWAIEYAHRAVEAPYKNEEELLKAITARVAEPGLQYATDEDTFFFSPDPYVNRFDTGKDPMDFAGYRMQQATRLMKDLADWGVEDGESYNRLRKTFDRLLFTYGYSARLAARFVGGIELHRDRKGDPDERPPFEVIDAAKQRQALGMVCDKIFEDDNYDFSPKLLNKLAAGRFWHWDSDQFDLFTEYPLHDRVRMIQYRLLFTLLNPFTLNRIYNAELQVEPDAEALTIAELFDTLTDAIWSELDDDQASSPSGRKPLISSLRRGLQRSYLRILIDLVVYDSFDMGVPPDVRSVVHLVLGELSSKIDAKLQAAGQKLDTFSRAHLTEAKMRIDKALEAIFLAH